MDMLSRIDHTCHRISQLPQEHIVHGSNRNAHKHIDSGATHHAIANFCQPYHSVRFVDRGTTSDWCRFRFTCSFLWFTCFPPTETFTLNNIMCAPKISMNFFLRLSLQKIIHSFEIHPSYFTAKGLHQELLQGSLQDGLYCLLSGNGCSPPPKVYVSIPVSSTLWQ